MMRVQYGALFRIASVYWRLYGGWTAFFTSPYLHFAVLLTITCLPFWAAEDSEWAQASIEIIPSTLGFSIGAFAILLAFGQQNVFDVLKASDESKSKYIGVVVAFLHFILFQVVALLVALIGKAYDAAVLGALGFLLTAYAVLMGAAAGVRLFRLARIYNQMTEAAGVTEALGAKPPSQQDTQSEEQQ